MSPRDTRDLAPLRVLLVEDHRVDAAVLLELLDQLPDGERPAVTHVDSATRAEQALAAQDYDCVLLDLGLPDGEGVENIERIRDAGRGAAIVVMTGLDDEHRAAESLRRGAQEYLVKGRLDSAALLRHLRHAIHRHLLVRDLDQQHEQQKQLAGQDPLTGLANRQRLAEHAREALELARARGERLALVFIDLDGFKAVNDHLGHALGDAVLVQVGRVLRSATRGKDTVARLGGDEFVVIQSAVRDAHEARDTAERLAQALSNIRRVEGQALSIGASAGVALFPDHGDSFEELLLHADSAMYRIKRRAHEAKAEGARPIWSRADPQTIRTSSPTPDARLAFQPFIDARGGIAGVEALLRPLSGGIAPATLLRESERLGLHSGLPQWVLAAACAEWQRWHLSSLQLGRLAINIGPAEAAHADFPTLVLAALERGHLWPTQLQLEIAEHLIEAGGTRMAQNFAYLRRQGVRVLIDRFGRDLAALRHLVELPIDGVKLDRGVVAGLDAAEARARRALVAGVVHTASLMGLEVVAVGVESEAEAHSCLQQGCSGLQGTWVAPPGEAEFLPLALTTLPALHGPHAARAAR